MESIFIHENIVASLLLVAAVFIVRIISIKRILNDSFESDMDTKRRWINTIKNVSITIMAIGIIVIWLSEIQAFAFSVAAFIVALVISTREYIQCIVGSLYRASSRAFNVGDWVQIGHFSGEVTNTDWLTTTLHEIDLASPSYSYTGQEVVVPNSLILTQPTKDLSFMKQNVSHTFTLVMEPEKVDVFKIKQYVLEQLAKYCEEFSEATTKCDAKRSNRLDISLDGGQPSVRITTSEVGKSRFTVTVYCPTKEAVNIEQKIIEDFMKMWHQLVADSKLESKPVAG